MTTQTLTPPDSAAQQAAAPLDLLLPGDLPRDFGAAPMPPEWQEVIDAFLSLLDSPVTNRPTHDRAARCHALLDRIGAAPARPVATGPTAIPASTAEVEDFDRYFQLRRVAADDPAHVLLRGLVQTAAAVFSLSERGDLPAAPLARLADGFSAYARLLRRMGTGEPAR